MTTRQTGPNDKAVGRRVQALRERAGWTQTSLSKRMADAGWPNYTQMTVSRTEKGERSLKLVEANDLASVLHVPLEALISDGSSEKRVDPRVAALTLAHELIAEKLREIQ